MPARARGLSNGVHAMNGRFWSPKERFDLNIKIPATIPGSGDDCSLGWSERGIEPGSGRRC